MADGSHGLLGNRKQTDKKRPRIAFTGEEFGFGYQAVGEFLKDARQYGVSEGGRWAVSRRTEREIDPASANNRFNFSAETPQPLRTKEQALMAVKQDTADFALVPFYSPYAGYDFETLRAMSSLITLLGVEQVEASDQLCLAVHESQVLELAQSAHPGSAFSSLMSKRRREWRNEDEVDETSLRDIADSHATYRAGLNIDQAGQKLLRDRVNMVFAGPEASRRCKSKLDGLRAIGVEVQETPQMVEPHRELAKRARSTLNPGRQTNTFFDPRDGKTHFISTMGADAQQTPLYGMVLPFHVAMMSSDYIIVDENLDDATPAKTRFMVVETNPDLSLFEEALRTTDAKTRYWFKRLRSIAFNGPEGKRRQGVRVMLRFRRDGTAASIGDVENFLRNYGVRHSVVRLDEDSEGERPASVALDIEFDAKDFDHNIISMFTRRLRGSVVNGAVKKAFQRWKNRGVLVLAAMPFEEAQLPRHVQRRWHSEAVGDWFADFIETMFIRMTRLMVVILPLGVAMYYIWKWFNG